VVDVFEIKQMIENKKKEKFEMRIKEMFINID